MAGFEVTLYGRIWVTPEATNGSNYPRVRIVRVGTTGTARPGEAARSPRSSRGRAGNPPQAPAWRADRAIRARTARGTPRSRRTSRPRDASDEPASAAWDRARMARVDAMGTARPVKPRGRREAARAAALLSM